MAVFGAVRIPDDKERLVRWIRDIEGFRKAADLGLSRDQLPAGDQRLRGARARLRGAPGPRALQARRLRAPARDRAIARFQTEVDWAAPDAGRRANLLTRQILLGYAEAYPAAATPPSARPTTSERRGSLRTGSGS